MRQAAAVSMVSMPMPRAISGAVIEAVLSTYRDLRNPQELFIDTVRRVGIEPFKEAGKSARLPEAAESTTA